MKFLKAASAILSLFFVAGAAMASDSYTNQQANEDSARIDAIVKNIQKNGPPELQQLTASTIRDAARSFVIGERSGSISPNQMARMGGAEQATKNSLMGQLRALGSR